MDVPLDPAQRCQVSAVFSHDGSKIVMWGDHGARAAAAILSLRDRDAM
jgi:hypothetical protein